MRKTTGIIRCFIHRASNYRKLSYRKLSYSKFSYKPMGYFMLACSLVMASTGYADPKSYTLKLNVVIPKKTMDWIQKKEGMNERPESLLLTPHGNTLVNTGEDMEIELKEKTDTGSNSDIIYTGQVTTHEIIPYDTTFRRPDYDGGDDYDNGTPSGSADHNGQEKLPYEELAEIAKKLNHSFFSASLSRLKSSTSRTDASDKQQGENDKPVIEAAVGKKKPSKAKKTRRGQKAAESTTSTDAADDVESLVLSPENIYPENPDLATLEQQSQEVERLQPGEMIPMLIYAGVSAELQRVCSKMDDLNTKLSAFERPYQNKSRKRSRSKHCSPHSSYSSQFALSFKNKFDSHETEVIISNAFISIKYNYPEVEEGDGFFSILHGSNEKLTQEDDHYLDLKSNNAATVQDDTVTISIKVALTKTLSKNRKQQAGKQDDAMQPEPEAPETIATIETGENEANRSVKTQQTTAAAASTTPTMTQAVESAWRGTPVFPTYMHSAFAGQLTPHSMAMSLPPMPPFYSPQQMHSHPDSSNLGASSGVRGSRKAQSMKMKASTPDETSSYPRKKPRFRISQS